MGPDVVNWNTGRNGEWGADCDLFLDYGDGGTLSVWEISEENDYGYDAQKWVSFILYENEDYSYGYLSGNKKMVDMYIRLKY